MIEHKKREELQEKIVARRKEIQEAFTLAEREGPPERRNGLEASLRLVDDALQGGWDKVSEVGAAELTHWLETTQSMVAAAAPKTEPKAEETIPAKEPDKAEVTPAPAKEPDMVELKPVAAKEPDPIAPPAAPPL